MFNLKKKLTIGVSITPEVGLEVAQIDFTTKTVVKYACKHIPYDLNHRDVSDMDIFRETLEELLLKLDIPKGSNIVLNVPAVTFNIADYPASLDEATIEGAIEDDLNSIAFFKDSEPTLALTKLPVTNMQFNKYAYVAAHKTSLVEMALVIRELGYNIIGIESSVNSILNTMMYNGSLAEVSPETSWVLLLIENNCCRAFMMHGNCYLECYEEKISIGEVLGEEENYSIVLSAIAPILKNIPSQFLYVVSKTNLINAEQISNGINYNSQIIHQNANIYAESPFIEIQDGAYVEENKFVSPDVIGAAIKKEIETYSNTKLDLYNKNLGNVYAMYQPPTIKVGNFSFETNEENMIKASIIYAIALAVIFFLFLIPLATIIKNKQNDLDDLNQKIASIDKFLKNNESISASLFDEGDEIRIGIAHNKKIYSYYTIVGTEIPQKLWLTGLQLNEKITINGQADNLESIYSFYRNIKDYDLKSELKLQKLGLATREGAQRINPEGDFDTDSILTSMNADFYEFKISDEKEVEKAKKETKNTGKESKNKNSKNKKTSKPPKSLP